MNEEQATEIWRRSQEEVELGLIGNPIDYEDLPTNVKIVTPRRMIHQKDKDRLIDG